MTRKTAIGIIALIIGIGALLAISLSGLWSSYEHARETAKPAPPPMLLTPAAKGGDEATLRAAVAKAPTDPVALTKLGDHYAVKRDFAAAITQYKKAVVAEPDYSVAWSALGETYVQTIQSSKTQLPPEAHDAFMRAVAIDTNDLRARFYLAMEKDFLGQHDQAINDWVRMLAMVPMGSQADSAIRAAIVGSMGRSATILRARVDAATQTQKALRKPATANTP